MWDPDLRVRSGFSRDTSSALELSGVGRRWRCSRARPILLCFQKPSGLGVGSRPDGVWRPGGRGGLGVGHYLDTADSQVSSESVHRSPPAVEGAGAVTRHYMVVGLFLGLL